MALTSEQVRHVAKLARIELSDEEVERFTIQLESVFEHLDKLNEVDTEKIPETAQVNELVNVSSPDTVSESMDREDFLKTSERDNERGMIKVRKSI